MAAPSGIRRDHRNEFVNFNANSLLGIRLQTPNAEKLIANLTKRQPRQQIDIRALFIQAGTTGYKLAAAERFYDGMLEAIQSYNVNPPDKGGEVQGSMEIESHFRLMMAIDCFFTNSWGSLISTMRETWLVHKLKLKSDNVNYYKTREALQKAQPNSALTNYIETAYKKDWYRYLNIARNRVEHGQTPMFDFRIDGAILLADDQSTDPDQVTTLKEYQPKTWCDAIITECTKFVDVCSSELNIVLFD